MKKRTKSEDEDKDQQAACDDRPRMEATEIEDNEAGRGGLYLFSFTVLVVGFLLAFAVGFPWLSYKAFVPATLFAFLCTQTIRTALQWERVVVLRFGRFHRIAGPGIYFCIPIIEYPTIRVDQRIKTASFTAEAALTADLVPVDVDAILFWMVWDAKKACLEVDNYPKAVLRSAQTALRDAIGLMNLANLSSHRREIDLELEELLGNKCENWGITIFSVEIRDITIPRDLQSALSREAQAERERNARVILAEVEKDISEMFVEAAEVYEDCPTAIHLRTMNLAYESSREGKGILLVPTSLAEGFETDKFFNS